MIENVQLGVVLLCHANLNMAARMARVWVSGGARVAVHIDAKASSAEVQEMQEYLSDIAESIRYSRRHKCEWGQFSLVEATQDAATLLLETWPELTHVYLASGSCLPLRPIRELADYLAVDPERNYIESVDINEVNWVVGGLNEERFSLYFPVDWRKHRKLFDRLVNIQRRFGIKRKLPQGISPHIGSQWWCLTSNTLLAILNDPRRQEYDRFFRKAWIPDECYFQTLVRHHSSKVESQSLTLAKFDHHGRPYMAYDDHLRALEESRGFVARKIWPGATALLNHFPLPEEEISALDAPQAGRIDRLIGQRVQRQFLGRPGLYMQSRFPMKDAENGKTSSPYAVFQGLTDIFEGFEDWLAEHLPGATVHGHLLGPEKAEFSGRGKIGPGALSSSAAIRDRDPQGFLTSLIRISDKMQVFQFSPRDNQDLNWFMATDPNAHIIAVTGAWNITLLQSGMPFDDVRRITALLQRTELLQKEILNSVWTKARVHLWDLSTFISRPHALLERTLLEIDRNAKTVTELPKLRDMTGLPEHLHRLHNSGLHTQLIREFQALNMSQKGT